MITLEDPSGWILNISSTLVSSYVFTCEFTGSPYYGQDLEFSITQHVFLQRERICRSMEEDIGDQLEPYYRAPQVVSCTKAFIEGLNKMLIGYQNEMEGRPGLGDDDAHMNFVSPLSSSDPNVAPPNLILFEQIAYTDHAFLIRHSRDISSLFALNGATRYASCPDEPLAMVIPGFPDTICESVAMHRTKNEAYVIDTIKNVLKAMEDHASNGEAFLVDQDFRSVLSDVCFQGTAESGQAEKIGRVSYQAGLNAANKHGVSQVGVAFSPHWMLPFKKESVPQPDVFHELFNQFQKKEYRCVVCAMKAAYVSKLETSDANVCRHTGEALTDRKCAFCAEGINTDPMLNFVPSLCSLSLTSSDPKHVEYTLFAYLSRVQFAYGWRLLEFHNSIFELANSYYSKNHPIEHEQLYRYLCSVGVWKDGHVNKIMKTFEKGWNTLIFNIAKFYAQKKESETDESKAEKESLHKTLLEIIFLTEMNGSFYFKVLEAFRLRSSPYSNVVSFLFAYSESIFREAVEMMADAAKSLVLVVLGRTEEQDQKPAQRDLTSIEVENCRMKIPFARVMTKVLMRSSVLKQIQNLQSQHPSILRDYFCASEQRLKEGVDYAGEFVEACQVKMLMKRGFYFGPAHNATNNGKNEDQKECNPDFQENENDLEAQVSQFLTPTQFEFISKHSARPGIYILEEKGPIFMVMVDGSLYTVLLYVTKNDYNKPIDMGILRQLQEHCWYTREDCSQGFCIDRQDEVFEMLNQLSI